MSLTKLSLDGNNLTIPGQGEFGQWHPGWGRENRKPFFTVYSEKWGHGLRIWKAFSQNGSNDTSFDPPLFSLVSTFQYYLRKWFPKSREFIFFHLPWFALFAMELRKWWKIPASTTILSVYGSLSASLQRQLSFPFSSFSTLSSTKLNFLILFYSEGIEKTTNFPPIDQIMFRK
jgi:hypothetical protein